MQSIHNYYTVVAKYKSHTKALLEIKIFRHLITYLFLPDTNAKEGKKVFSFLQIPVKNQKKQKNFVKQGRFLGDNKAFLKKN